MSELNFQAGGVTPPAGSPPAGDHASQGKPQGNAPEQGGSDQSFIEYGGKALSKEEVLKKLANADQFIDTLKTERQGDLERLSRLEEAVGKSSKVEEVLAALQGKQEPAQPAETPAAALDVESLTAGVLDRLNARDTANTEESNWNSVTKTLTEHYGDKVNEKVRAVAVDNDMTVEEVAALARKRPKVFLKLFGGDLKGSTTTAPLTVAGRPGVRAAGTAPAAPTGYMQARTTRDQVSIYKQRLAELSGR